jgi:hypothetical protein
VLVQEEKKIHKHTEGRLCSDTGKRCQTQVFKRDFRRTQPAGHLDLGFVASRTLRKLKKL